MNATKPDWSNKKKTLHLVLVENSTSPHGEVYASFLPLSLFLQNKGITPIVERLMVDMVEKEQFVGIYSALVDTLNTSEQIIGCVFESTCEITGIPILTYVSFATSFKDFHRGGARTRIEAVEEVIKNSTWLSKEEKLIVFRIIAKGM